MTPLQVVAWMMTDGTTTMWIGVVDAYVLIGTWGKNYWEWDVTRTRDAKGFSIWVTRDLEMRRFHMHTPPMWMEVDDPDFVKGLERFAASPHPHLNKHLVRAFGTNVVAMAVAGVPV